MTISPEDTYVASATASYPLDREMGMVVTRDQREVFELDLFTCRILSTCQGVRTIGQHVEAAKDAGARADRESISSALERLIGFGLLRRHSHQAAKAEETVKTWDGIPTSVVVVTQDKPAALKRSLSSWMEHCVKFGHAPRFLVIDVSAYSHAQEANRSIISDLERHHGRRIQCIRTADAMSIRAGLAALIRPEVVQWALGGGGVGAGWNTAILATVGENVLVSADAVLCRPWTLHSGRGTFLLVGHRDLRLVTPCISHGAALGSVPASDLDLLSAHGSVLGRSLQTLRSLPNWSDDLSHACGHVIEGFSVPAQWIVRVSVTGAAGSLGTGPVEGLLFGRGRLTDRIASEALAFDTAPSSHGLIYSQEHLLSHQGFRLAASMGIDNQSAVPPFLPEGTKADLLFSTVMRGMHPSVMFSHLPHGIILEEQESVESGIDATSSATGCSLEDLLLALLKYAASAPAGHASPSVRLQRIGRYLSELAGLRSREFASLATESLLEAKCADFRTVAAALETGGGSSDGLKRAFAEHQRVFRQHVGRPDFFVPAWCKDASVEIGFQRAQLIVKNYAELLQAWPLIWKERSGDRVE